MGGKCIKTRELSFIQLLFQQQGKLSWFHDNFPRKVTTGSTRFTLWTPKLKAKLCKHDSNRTTMWREDSGMCDAERRMKKMWRENKGDGATQDTWPGPIRWLLSLKMESVHRWLSRCSLWLTASLLSSHLVNTMSSWTQVSAEEDSSYRSPKWSCNRTFPPYFSWDLKFFILLSLENRGQTMFKSFIRGSRPLSHSACFAIIVGTAASMH